MSSVEKQASSAAVLTSPVDRLAVLQIQRRLPLFQIVHMSETAGPETMMISPVHHLAVYCLPHNDEGQPGMPDWYALEPLSRLSRHR